MGSSEAPSGGSQRLPAGVVARVGVADVAAETVMHIAADQQLRVAQASDAAITDALWAVGASEQLGPAAVRSAERRELARVLLAQLWAESTATPPTAGEVAQAVARHWIRLDRPRGYRTVHAVVMIDEHAPAEQRQQARALAGQLRDAVKPAAARAAAEPGPVRDDEQMFEQARGVRDRAADAFTKAAGAVDAHGLQVKIEQLMPVAADGRIIDQHGRPGAIFVESFALAASRLRRRGDLSEVIETPFGYHVIMLLETTPEARLSAHERLLATREEIFRARATRLRDELVGRLRAERKAAMTANSDALMAAVDVSGRAAGPR